MSVTGPRAIALCPSAPAPPSLGKSFTGSATGLVLIEINGKFVPITELSKIPNGAVINALHGTLTLNTAATGGTQHATLAAKHESPVQIVDHRNGDGPLAAKRTPVPGLKPARLHFPVCDDESDRHVEKQEERSGIGERHQDEHANQGKHGSSACHGSGCAGDERQIRCRPE